MADPALNNVNVDSVPSDGPEPEVNDARPQEGEDLAELAVRLRSWFRLDRDHSAEWREDARDWRELVAGRQWSADDMARLREQFRVPITFDQISRLVNIVCGLETGNRQEVRYIPREMGDVGVNELLTEAAKWARDECDAEDEESSAFRDATITGMGWTDTRPEYDVNPQGLIGITRIDCLEMYWDAGAKKNNLEDARRLFRVKDIPLYEAQEMYPGKSSSELHAGWADDLAGGRPHDAEQAKYYPEGNGGGTDSRDTVRMVEAQWWEYQTYYLSIDPFTGTQAEFPEDKFGLLRERLAMLGVPEPPSVKQRRRVYRQAILGQDILEVTAGPAEGGFSWKCITGYKDDNKGTWYGIVRAMADPQRLANKLLSQTLHLMNVGAKGGIMAEADAFDDIRDAEQNWADPSSIVIMANGAIRENKVMPRPVAPMPPALGELLPLSFSAIRDSAGINLELLGLVERDQPGVLEHMRKQAGMTVLATLFDSLRRYRKDQGRLLLWNITTFISDGRLIRIGGPESAKYVPLLNQPGMVEYDVIVDDTPTSPNMKERTWGVLMQMMPFLSRLQIPPHILMELLKYSPFPETVIARISKLAEQAQQQSQQNPGNMMIAAKAQSEIARAKLLNAQAEQAKVDAVLGSAAARAENFNNQVQALEAAQRSEEIKARVENLRSQAIANLAKAGATQRDAYTNQLLAVLDVLDTMTAMNQPEEQGTPA